MIIDWTGSLERQVKRLKEMKDDSDKRIDELTIFLEDTEAERDELKASISLYADQVDRQAKEVQVYHRDNADLKAEYEKTKDNFEIYVQQQSETEANLRAALEQVEYVTVYHYISNDSRTHTVFCPWCNCSSEYPSKLEHSPTCPRQLALGLADGEAIEPAHDTATCPICKREFEPILWCEDCCNRLTDNSHVGEAAYERCIITGNMIDECECDVHAGRCAQCGHIMHLMRSGTWRCPECG